jgi:hypothetical protein
MTSGPNSYVFSTWLRFAKSTLVEASPLPTLPPSGQPSCSTSCTRRRRVVSRRQPTPLRGVFAPSEISNLRSAISPLPLCAVLLMSNNRRHHTTPGPPRPVIISIYDIRVRRHAACRTFTPNPFRGPTALSPNCRTTGPVVAVVGRPGWLSPPSWSAAA